MDLWEVLDKRYSYRGGYKSDPVPREALKRIMEAGLCAPSGCNMQTASLIGIDDADTLAALGEILQKPHFSSAPAAICVLTRKLKKFSDYYNVQDYAAAIENMLLAITDLGYASCWVEGYVTSFDVGARMAKVLNVPADYQLVAYLPVGVPLKDTGSTITRKPFAARAWFNGFGRV